MYRQCRENEIVACRQHSFEISSFANIKKVTAFRRFTPPTRLFKERFKAYPSDARRRTQARWMRRAMKTPTHFQMNQGDREMNLPFDIL